MALIDVHCHLDAPVYQDIEAVCRRNHQAGVAVTVATGTGTQSNEHILALQQQYQTRLWAAIGLHPERLDTTWEEVETVLAQIHIHRACVVALGEIGLPHYALRAQRMTTEQARQHEAMLHTLVQAAVHHSLPVVLHAPHDTATTALTIVQRYGPPGALFHWHKGPAETTAALCAAGYYLSVTPEVCYRDRDRQLVQAVSLDNLLLESDGPWPYAGEFAGQTTTSAMVARTAQEIARLKGLPLDEVIARTTANAEKLFGRVVSPP